MRFRVSCLVCVVATAALVTASACDSFDGETTSDLVDGGIPTPVDGGPPPAHVDGGDAGLPPFCVFGEHAFCSDFEGAAPLEAWTVNTPEGITLDGERVVSGVASLRARDARRPDGGAERIVGVAKSLPRAWSRVVVNLSLFVAKPVFQPGDNNGLGLLALNFVSSDASRAHGVALSLGDGSTTFAATKAQSLTLAGLAPDKWIRIRLDVTPNKEALLFIDDAAQQVIALPTAPPPKPDAGAPPESAIRLDVGSLGWNSPSPAMDVRVDDVTIDFPP